MKKNAGKPWCDLNGKPLSSDYLKIVSKKWDKQTWEEYLKENIDVCKKEYYLNKPLVAENLLNTRHSLIFPKGFDLIRNIHMKNAIKDLVEALPKQKRRIITDIYWNDLRISEISKKWDFIDGQLAETIKEHLAC